MKNCYYNDITIDIIIYRINYLIINEEGIYYYKRNVSIKIIKVY